jgi:hypothetical protein
MTSRVLASTKVTDEAGVPLKLTVEPWANSEP